MRGRALMGEGRKEHFTGGLFSVIVTGDKGFQRELMKLRVTVSGMEEK